MNDLVGYLKDYLSVFDSKISNIKIIYGPKREGDIPHSHASIVKANKLLAYNPHFSLKKGLEKAINWYWKNL